MSTTPTTEPTFYVGTDTLIQLNGQSVECLLSHVDLTPDVATNDFTTFCGTQVYPGNVTWTLNATFYQSFDDNGTNQILDQIWQAYQTAGTHPTYLVQAFKDRPVSVNNPQWTGTLTPQPFAVISMDAGGPSEIDISWTCDQTPTMSTTPTSAPAP